MHDKNLLHRHDKTNEPTEEGPPTVSRGHPSVVSLPGTQDVIVLNWTNSSLETQSLTWATIHSNMLFRKVRVGPRHWNIFPAVKSDRKHRIYIFNQVQYTSRWRTNKMRVHERKIENFKSHDAQPLKGQERKLFFKHYNFSSLIYKDFEMFFILFENWPQKFTVWRLSYDCLIYISGVRAKVFVCKFDYYLMREIREMLCVK